MSIAHLLEDFTIQADGGTLHLLNEDALEDQRLAAFDQGYGAGWDDAIQAQEQSRDHISAELSKALEDMSFTYHEALTRMAMSLEPMFESLVQLVLPHSIDRSFAIRLTEQLRDMAREQIDQPMQILVPEGRGAEVEGVLLSDMPQPPRVIEDPSLEPGQARLQVGISRRDVDCADLLASVEQAFDSYIFEAKEAVSHD